jgi:hypothetical protein
VFLALLASCGTILHGTRQLVTVQSSPSGAVVHISPDTGTFTTPVTLNLERKNRYVLTFTSPGYSTATLELRPDVALGTAFADGFFTGMVGALVDALTGALYGLKPETPSATLSRDAGTGSGPNEIHIRLSGAAGGSAITVRSDAPVVGTIGRSDHAGSRPRPVFRAFRAECMRPSIRQ